MKKTIKLVFTAIIFICISAMILCGCNCSNNTGDSTKDKDKGQEPTQTVITVSLPETLAINLFESKVLTAETNSKQAVVYSSSDEAILTVASDSGALTPHKAGTATITATVEGKTAESKVTVSAPEESDISLINVDKEVTVKIGKSSEIETLSFWKEKQLTDVTYTYTSSTTDVVSIDSTGKITGVSKGSATITVSGTKSGVTLGSDTVSITVIDDIVIETSTDSVELYTNTGGDSSLEMQKDVTISVILNDEVVTAPALSIVSSDDDVANVTISSNGGTFVANGKKGSATITISYISPSGTTQQKQIAVTTIHPTKNLTVDGVNYIGKNREGTLLYTPTFTLASVTSAYIGETEYPTRKDNSDIVVDLSGMTASETTYNVVVTADSYDTTYKLTLSVAYYDYLIGTNAEFTDFVTALNGTNYYYAKLTGNVDMQNTTIETANNKLDGSGANNITAFTLDGSGYTLSNLGASSVRGAIAEQISKNSVIKNIAFYNVDASNINAGGLFVYVRNTQFENVYLSISINTAIRASGTISFLSYENVTYNNVVVYLNGTTADKSVNTVSTGATTTAPLGALTSAGYDYTTTPYTNTYAINPVAKTMVMKSSTDETEKYTEGLYTSWAEFAENVSSLPESFSDKMWEINSYGELVFKSMPKKHIHDYVTLDSATGNYTCSCGVSAVNPFKDLQNAGINSFISDFTSSEETTFGVKTYKTTFTDTTPTTITIGSTDTIDSHDYDNAMYFAIKATRNIQFNYSDGNRASKWLLQGTWYLMKLEQRTNSTNGGWRLYMKEIGADDSTYYEMVYDGWRLGDHSVYNGKAHFDYFLTIGILATDSTVVEVTPLYTLADTSSDPFSDKTKVDLSSYVSDPTTTTEKLFDANVYSKTALCSTNTYDNSIGTGNIDSKASDDTYYFAIKGDKKFNFIHDSATIYLLPDVWYIIKLEPIATNGYNMYARALASKNYTSLNSIASWRRGTGSGELSFNSLLVFQCDESVNLELTDFYAEEPTFANAFADLTKVHDSVLSTTNGATLTDGTIGGSSVYKRSSLTNNTAYDKQSLGSNFDMSASGTYNEYYFAIKVNVAYRFGSSGTNANDLSKNLWYMIKLVKRTASGTRGWDVYAKRVLDDDNNYKQISVDNWKVGDHDNFAGNTQPTYFMDVYCIDDSTTFDLYGTAIYAKV